MGKGRESASVIILLGTSTAGKTTICSEVVRQNSQLPAAQQLDWQIDGNDIAGDRSRERILKAIGGNCDPFNPFDVYFFSLLKDDSRFQKIQDGNAKFKEAAKDPEFARPIYVAIINGKFDGLPLLNDDEFDKSVEGFIQKNEDKYSKKMLEALKALAQEKHQEFEKVAGGVEEEMFQRAIDNSRAGKPTILDVVNADAVEKFAKYCDAQNFTCPVHVALVHLPVAELVDRMDQRNVEARAAGGNKDNARDGMFPFHQYTSLFSAVRTGERVVGKVSDDDLMRAAKRFGKERDSEESDFALLFSTPKEFEELRRKLEMPDGASSTELAAKVYHDGLYSSSSRESTSDIARRVIKVATGKSSTPTEPSPTADLVSADLASRGKAVQLVSPQSMSEAMKSGRSRL